MQKKGILPLVGGLILCIALLSACGTSNSTASAASPQKNTSTTVSGASTQGATPVVTLAANPAPTLLQRR